LPTHKTSPAQHLPGFVAVKYALVYAVVALIWILVSDNMVSWFTHDIRYATMLNSVKGTLFVVVTSLLLYFLLQRIVSRNNARDQRLTDSELQYRLMFESNPNPMWIYDKHSFSFLAVNDAAIAQYGYSREEFLGMTILGIRPVSEVPSLLESVSAHTGGLEHSGIWRHQKKDGGQIDVEITHHHLVFESHQADVVMAVDITERKKSEEMIRSERMRYLTLLKSSTDGIHVLDTKGNIVEVNNEFCEMLGYPHEVLTRMNVSQLDAQLSSKEIKKSIKEGLHNKERRRFETVHRRKNGSHFPVEITTTAMEVDGQTLIYCSSRDITERRQSEEKLKLAASIYEASAEGVLVTDAENRIVAVNPAFTQTTGYSIDEIAGKTPTILASGRHDEAFYQGMWQALETTGHWHGEVWNRRKDGAVFPEWLTINTIYNADGSILHYVAMFLDISEKKESDELIWRQANFDPLCQLPNRRMFRDRLEHGIKKAHRNGLRLALFFIDLDRFKEVNDTLGHHVGDLLLEEAARRISDCVRESDTVARLGGDEFTIVLSDLEDASIAERLAQNIIQKLAEPFKLENETVYLSASIGITFYPEDGANGEDLLKNADQAMYVAKDAGRNRYGFFTSSLQEAAQKRLRLITDLRQALAADQFRLYYQPIVDLASGHITKAEALLRWQHPSRGIVSPMEFIPLAEETGFINEIGEWVFRESACQVKRWAELYGTDFQVSVNKSPVQFQAAANHESWIDYLEQLGLSGQNIVIEITEGLLLNTESGIATQLLRFRDARVQVAIDDFGTGYSALSYLKKFDIDYLKIDQSFVRNLAHDPDDLALCEAIIVMAHKLGLKVIAEGIETEEQRNLLVSNGCDYGQGYLFSRPVPPDEFEALLKNRCQPIS